MELKEITSSQIYVPVSGIRISNRIDDDEMSNLVEHIKIHGILEPIVVFAVDDLSEEHELYESRKEFKGQYEILTGQRRFVASRILDREFPGNGWDKIKCIVRDPPKDNLDGKAISLGAGITQCPMMLSDIISTCDDLFRMYNDENIVAKKTGISISLIKKYVKFNRLPGLLKDNLQLIHKNNKVAVNIALKAADALCWTRCGDVSEETVLELAKALGNAKHTSSERYKKFIQAAEDHPGYTLEQIEEESLKLKSPVTYSIVLDGYASHYFKDLAERQGILPEDLMSNTIDEYVARNHSENND